MAAPQIPGVSIHAMQRQAERWPTPWSREVWLDVVTQILRGAEGVGDRRALLVRIAEPDRKVAIRRGGWDRASISECWLVLAPDGPARVWWSPVSAIATTVMGPTGEFNSQRMLQRDHGHAKRVVNRRAHSERERIVERLRAREDREQGL